MERDDLALTQELYQVVEELRFIASWGLHFTQDPYDRERYYRIRAIGSRLVAAIEQRPQEELFDAFARDLFGNGISPLSTVDAVVIRQGRMLLIQRPDDGLWALPGGFVEVRQTLAGAALRELQEETGLCGRVVKLLGIFDSRRWGSSETAHIHHVIFLVEAGEGEPQPTPEAKAVAFFSEAELPALSSGHHLRVPFIYRLLREELPMPYLDGAEPVPGCD
jgi:ADP-ribose pyrophosphatase YjhB (NUDIX family)